MAAGSIVTAFPDYTALSEYGMNGATVNAGGGKGNSMSKRDINSFVAMQMRWGMVWAGLQIAACLVALVTLVMFRGLV